MRTLGCVPRMCSLDPCFPDNERRTIKDCLFLGLKKLLPFLIAAIVACFFACFIQNHWNRMVMTSLHGEMSVMSQNVNNKLTGMENATKKIVLLLKAMEENLNPSGAEGSTAALIQKYLALYDADKTGLTDYALESIGGCVLSVRDTAPYKYHGGGISLFGVPISNPVTEARAVIQASVLPGDCWAFEGSTGNIVLQLVTAIEVTHISVEHIPPTLAPNGKIDSAPKSFALLGLRSLSDHSPHIFGNYIYLKSGPPLQTFAVQTPSPWYYDMVEVVIKSNHGKLEYTCVYRLRIHGKVPGPEQTSDQLCLS